MTTEELTKDIASIKESVATLQQQVQELGAKPRKKWWDRESIATTSEELEMFDEMTAYGKYYRITGQDAPTEWRPGDPFPEPEYPE